MPKGSGLGREYCCLLLLHLALRKAASLSWRRQHDQRMDEMLWRQQGSGSSGFCSCCCAVLPCATLKCRYDFGGHTPIPNV